MSGAPCRVLIVDDFPDAADASCMLLTVLGHSCRIAKSGTAALELIEQFDPDIVILDIGLPDLSGYEIARTLRAHSTRAYLAALTGWGASSDRDRAFAAGFDLHVVKPASAEKLCGIVERAMRRQGEQLATRMGNVPLAAGA